MARHLPHQWKRLDAHWPAGKRPPRISTRTIATELSPTSPRSPDLDSPDGRPACALATTTTTVGMTYSAFWGHNILFHNNGNGTFTDVTRKAGLYQETGGGEQVARFSITTGTAISTSSSEFVKLDPDKIRRRTTRTSASGRVCPRCVARAACRRHKYPLPQQR